MDREHVLGILRAHEAEFRAAGVVGMSLFGSVARGEPHPQDVDIAVRLGEGFSEGDSIISTRWTNSGGA